MNPLIAFFAAIGTLFIVFTPALIYSFCQHVAEQRHLKKLKKELDSPLTVVL